jgi:hypothetical protein
MEISKDKIIELETRDGCIKVYESVLSLSDSLFFKHVLKYLKESNKNKIFIDCDSNILKYILAYTETGRFPTNKYDLIYLKKIFNKFGIQIDIKNKISDKIKQTKQTKEQNREDVDIYLEIKNFIKKYSNLPEFDISIKFIALSTSSIHSYDNKLIFSLPLLNIEEVKNISYDEFVKKLSTSDYIVTGIGSESSTDTIIIDITFTNIRIKN